MKSKQIFVFFIAFAMMVSCGKQIEKNSPNPKATALQTKDSLTYNLEVKLEILNKGINIYEASPPSEKQIPMYFAAIIIKNLSKDTFPIAYWNCSFQKSLVFEPLLTKVSQFCDANYLEAGFLLQNQKIVFITHILDPAQYWYLQNNENLKVGFVIDRIKVGNKFINLSINKHQIYWSNSINLSYTSPSFYSYKRNGKDVLFLDSLNKNLENYFRYPVHLDY
jgi:hypothetical protein